MYGDVSGIENTAVGAYVCMEPMGGQYGIGNVGMGAYASQRIPMGTIMLELVIVH